MGNQPSSPQPGVKLQVIGAGLPRTGTTSFGEALRILLDGGVYHCGTQVTVGLESDIRGWIDILCRQPATTDQEKADMAARLHQCSMANVSSSTTMSFLRLVVMPLPTMRFFPDYINGLRRQYIHLYGQMEPLTQDVCHKHVAWLKSVVPADRLVFFDVKDGWEPLCKALGKEIPDVPFPKFNDSEAIEKFAAKTVKRGLQRWAAIIAVGAVAASVVWKFLGSR